MSTSPTALRTQIPKPPPTLVPTVVNKFAIDDKKHKWATETKASEVLYIDPKPLFENKQDGITKVIVWAATITGTEQHYQRVLKVHLDDKGSQPFMAQSEFSNIKQTQCGLDAQPGQPAPKKMIDDEKWTEVNKHLLQYSAVKLVQVRLPISAQEDKTKQTYWGLIMPYLGESLGAIDRRVKVDTPWEEKEVKKLLKDLGPVLSLLHRYNLCHADVKEDNILRDYEGNYVLVDCADVGKIQVDEAGKHLLTGSDANRGEQLSSYAIPSSFRTHSTGEWLTARLDNLMLLLSCTRLLAKKENGDNALNQDAVAVRTILGVNDLELKDSLLRLVNWPKETTPNKDNLLAHLRKFLPRGDKVVNTGNTGPPANFPRPDLGGLFGDLKKKVPVNNMSH